MPGGRELSVWDDFYTGIPLLKQLSDLRERPFSTISRVPHFADRFTVHGIKAGRRAHGLTGCLTDWPHYLVDFLSRTQHIDLNFGEPAAPLTF
jgi:hypothetical protein